MDFFVITKDNWHRACELGINPAAAYLVLARGTQRDDISTSWSAEAVSRYSHMSWRKAKKAIEDLVRAEIIRQSGSKTRPRYKLTRKQKGDSIICLPNEFITGATGEERPPVARLRSTYQTHVMALCVNLYSVHDLIHEGGLPRRLIWGEFERKPIMDIGQYRLFGFVTKGAKLYNSGPFERFKGIERGQGDAWDSVNTLVDLGLFEVVTHLVEAPRDGELIHAIAGDRHADEVRDALYRIFEALPEPYEKVAEQHDFVVPILRSYPRATIENIYRLRYQARTRGTRAWFAEYVDNCREAVANLREIGDGNLASNHAACGG